MGLVCDCSAPCPSRQLRPCSPTPAVLLGQVFYSPARGPAEKRPLSPVPAGAARGGDAAGAPTGARGAARDSAASGGSVRAPGRPRPPVPAAGRRRGAFPRLSAAPGRRAGAGGRFGAGGGAAAAPSIDDAVSRESPGAAAASGSRCCHSLPARSRQGLPFPPSPTLLS